MKRMAANFGWSVACWMVLCWSVMSWGSRLPAQEDVPPPAGGVIELQVTGAEDGSGGLVIGQTIISGNAGAQPIQFFSAEPIGMMGAPDTFGMLNDGRIREELGLVEDQWQELQEIQKQFSREVQERSRELMSGGFNPDRAGEMRDVMSAAREKMKERMSSVLLPHQQQRIDQLRNQIQLQSGATGDGLLNGRLAEALELTDKQKERLRERAEELEEELEAQIKRLKREAREKLLGELTSKQRKKLDELVGDRFDYEPPNVRDRLRALRSRVQADPLERSEDASDGPESNKDDRS